MTDPHAGPATPAVSRQIAVTWPMSQSGQWLADESIQQPKTNLSRWQSRPPGLQNMTGSFASAPPPTPVYFQSGANRAVMTDGHLPSSARQPVSSARPSSARVEPRGDVSLADLRREEMCSHCSQRTSQTGGVGLRLAAAADSWGGRR